MIRDLLTYLFLMFALLVGAHSYASDVHSTQDQLINDLAALELAHSSGETPTNEQEFLENILKRKNEHLRAQIDAIAAEPTNDESLSKLLSDQLDLMQRLLLLSETKIHQQAIEFRAAPDDGKSTLLVNLQRRPLLMDTYYGQVMATINQLESNAIPVDEAKAAFKQSVTERVDFLTNILLYK